MDDTDIFRNVRLDSPFTYAYETHEERKIESLKAKLADMQKEFEKAKKTTELPERYIINENATILFWKDGEKTIVKKCEDDEFNPRLAFLTAFFQHYCGMSKNKANKFLANLEIEKKQKSKEEKIEEKPKRGRPRKNEPKFKVGDKIIGNKLANDVYGITRTGWIGIVTGIKDNYFLARSVAEKNGTEFPLHYSYFNKYKEAK